MSKEAQDFYRSKKVENAKTENMKKFLSLVNYEEEGKIMQEYADQQLRLLSVVKCFGINSNIFLIGVTSAQYILQRTGTYLVRIINLNYNKKMEKEKLIEKMLNNKAEKNNLIDLNAYAIGLSEMYEALNMCGVGITFKEKIEKEIQELEIKHNMTHNKDNQDENELLLGLVKYLINVDVDDKNQP